MNTAEIVRDFYANYARRDMDAVMAHCADDVAFTWMASPDHSGQFSGVASGLDAFRERLTALDGEFEYLAIEVADIIAWGDRAAAQIRLTMRRRATGREFVMPAAGFWTLRDGKIVHYVEYYDTALGEAILAG